VQASAPNRAWPSEARVGRSRLCGIRKLALRPAALTDELVMALAKNAPCLVDLALGDGQYCHNQNLPVVLDALWNALTQHPRAVRCWKTSCGNGEWSKAALENFKRYGLKPDIEGHYQSRRI